MCPRRIACIGACLLFAAAPASSQPADGRSSPAPEDAITLLSGRYEYVGDPDEDHATIEESIEKAISNLGWLGRKIARNRLANHQELPSHIEISRLGDDLSVVMGTYSAVAPADGEKRELVGPNGRDAKLHYELAPKEIVQFFVFEHAQRKSTYAFNETDQLVMTVSMTSEKLASPIEYELVYGPIESASDQ